MIDHTLDTTHSVLHVQVTGSLEQEDFAKLANTVHTYVEQTGRLAGLVIEAPTFPGWESLGAMAAHFRFVRDHHKDIKKIAVVTDSASGRGLETEGLFRANR